MKLRIVHKGLVFILLPLLLQVACIFQLYQMMGRIETLAATQFRLSKFINVLDRILVDFVTGWMFAFQANAQIEDLDSSALQMHNLLESAKGLATNKDESRAMEIAESAFDEQNALMLRIRALKGQISDFEKVRLMYALRTKFDVLAQRAIEIKQLLAADQIQLDEAKSQEEATRRQLKSQILIGVAIEIALTLFILFVFLRDITQRLKVLVENAKIIPSHGALTKTVPGADELAYLDGVLHEASDELRQAAEHKRSLMQMVAHDIRSPLGTAKLEAESLIGAAPEGDAPQQSSATRIKKILDRVMYFVEDLLTLDKLESGKLELNYGVLHLNDIVWEAIESVLATASARGIKVSNDTSAVLVAGDKQRLLQVLTNLLSNAIKFSPQGGTVTVSSEKRPGDLYVAVRDAGTGVSREQQAKLFDKFYQADQSRSYQGFGLGLAICKLIIDAHGGAIGVESEPEKGSTFWFTIPVDADEDV